MPLCKGLTLSGPRCRKVTKDSSGYCSQHRNQGATGHRGERSATSEPNTVTTEGCELQHDTPFATAYRAPSSGPARAGPTSSPTTRNRLSRDPSPVTSTVSTSYGQLLRALDRDVDEPHGLTGTVGSQRDTVPVAQPRARSSASARAPSSSSRTSQRAHQDEEFFAEEMNIDPPTTFHLDEVDVGLMTEAELSEHLARLLRRQIELVGQEQAIHDGGRLARQYGVEEEVMERLD